MENVLERIHFSALISHNVKIFSISRDTTPIPDLRSTSVITHNIYPSNHVNTVVYLSDLTEKGQ